LDRMGRLLADNEESLQQTVTSLARFSKGANQFMDRMNGFTEQNLGRLHETVEDWEELSERLRQTSENLERVSTRVERGEGTAGKLLQGTGGSGPPLDLFTKVSNAADGVNWIGSSRAAFDVRADYLANASTGKAFFQFDFLPPEVWFTRFQLVARSRDDLPNAPSTWAWTAMVGARYRALAARVGVLESTLGVGADALLFQDRLRFSLEGWDFQRANSRAHTRAMASWTAFSPVFVSAGWDDLLNARSSPFLGLGLRFVSGTPPR
jgi:hypothetical protein